MSDKPSGAEGVARTVTTLGLVVLSFLLGALTTDMQIFPYTLLEGPFTALRAQLQAQRLETSLEASTAWVPDTNGKKGAVVHDRALVSPGYTLIGEARGTSARLIDIDGNVKHEWSLPFDAVWEDPPHIESPVPSDQIVWTGPTVMDNGDLIVHYNTEHDSPYGYAMVRLDKDSKLIWSFAGRTHHAFDVQDDGSVYALTHRFRNTDEEPVPGLTWRGEFLDDDVVYLDADGNEKWRFSLADAIGRSDFAETLFWRRPDHWDWLHTNSVRRVSAEWASHHQFAEAGDLMVSFRELDAIALVDPKSKTVRWATRGFWVAQHDPDLTAGGNVMIFDNLGRGGPGGRSRVVEFNPATGERVWTFEGSADRPFDSEWGGRQEVLPNGNVLVTESAGGRVLEVTRDGKIVWEYFTEHFQEEEGQRYRTAVGGTARHANLSFLGLASAPPQPAEHVVEKRDEADAGRPEPDAGAH